MRVPIRNYEGLYSAQDDGSIISFHKGEEKILRPFSSRNGYKIVLLSKNGVSKKYLVHRLVAMAFLVNPNKLPVVNHLNGNKSDNRAVNLEWTTTSENLKHAFRTGLKKPTMCRVGKNNEAHGKSRKIIQLSKEGGHIKEWPSVMEVKRIMGFSHGNVSACARGLLKNAYGFKWQYA